MDINRSKRYWSRRVKPIKIRQLYESDARGMLDQELLDDVGYGIYARCQDLIEVSEAWRGRVKCWGCGKIIVRQQGQIIEYHGHGPTLTGGKTEVLKCDCCSWQITWANYCKSASGMNATGIETVLRTFVKRWPAISSPNEKLLLIDELIHAFHMHYKRVGSSPGCTVIEATEKQLTELFDRLAYGAGSTRGLDKMRRVWASQRKAQQIQHSKSDLQAIARELGLKGYSRMSYQTLIEGIESVDPSRFAAWDKLVYAPKNGE